MGGGKWLIMSCKTTIPFSPLFAASTMRATRHAPQGRATRPRFLHLAPPRLLLLALLLILRWCVPSPARSLHRGLRLHLSACSWSLPYPAVSCPSAHIPSVLHALAHALASVLLTVQQCIDLVTRGHHFTPPPSLPTAHLATFTAVRVLLASVTTLNPDLAHP